MDGKRLLISITTLIIVGVIVFAIVSLPAGKRDQKPVVWIDYPRSGEKVYGIFIVRGRAYDPEGKIEFVEVKVNEGEWKRVKGAENWSCEVNTEKIREDVCYIYARAWDGYQYSDVVKVKVYIERIVESDIHKWAIFVAAANVEIGKKKLGNGILFLAEEMARYFINNLSFPSCHVFILFDDGWIRSNNGEGERICTLQERPSSIDGVIYGPATKKFFTFVIDKVKNDANKYNDSEVFMWISGHGVGDPNQKFTGGKILERSEIILWDSILSDRELGSALEDLKAKLCLIVDSCYSGGFANRVIFNIPSFLKSGIPKDGRIVITGESKFSIGYSSSLSGPLFTRLWFEGLKSGKADGFKRGILSIGGRLHFRFLKDGKVSVEEAFYYAKYMIRVNYPSLILMQPQINDMYPHPFPFNRREMFL